MSAVARATSRDWESTFSDWTGRASDAEQKRYEWTRNAINEALRGYPTLAKYSFEVYAKGSYPNFTNVVRDSDVDVAAELTELYRNEYIGAAEGLDLQAVGGTPYTGTYNLPAFKDDIERALILRFGDAAVDRGKKAIHVRESKQGLAADVVPCVTHKTWTSRTHCWRGVALLNDAATWQEIHNYPKQHVELGTDKNDRTSRRYKRVVRFSSGWRTRWWRGGSSTSWPPSSSSRRSGTCPTGTSSRRAPGPAECRTLSRTSDSAP